MNILNHCLQSRSPFIQWNWVSKQQQIKTDIQKERNQDNISIFLLNKNTI